MTRQDESADFYLVRRQPDADSVGRASAPAASRRRQGRLRHCFSVRSLLVLCLLTLLAPTAGCRREGPRVVTVRFWNGFTGPDGRTMLRMVKRFNAVNPDIHVLMQRMDWATYYNKLFVAGIGHRAPELFVIHTRAMQRFARAGFARPNDDLVAGREGIDVRDLDANVWNAVEFGGKHYGLPLDVHVMGMYYNRPMFREAGLTDARGVPKPPTDRAEFLNALRRMTRPGSNGRPDQWGFVFTNWESNCYTFMRQFGGEFFTPDYSRCIMNNPQNVAALQFCADLIRKYKYAPSPENFDAWIGFRQGKVGIVLEGIYMLADLQKQTDLDFAGAPVPQVGDHTAVWADSHNLCLRSDLKGAELRATWRFAKYLSDHSLDWAEGGQVPVRKSLRSTPRFHAMTVQSAFARQIPSVRYLPRLPFIFEFQTEFNIALEKALRGTATPQQALNTAAANVNRIIAREREANRTPLSPPASGGKNLLSPRLRGGPGWGTPRRKVRMGFIHRNRPLSGGAGA
jgi:multiple sugar transport system substrate-binding protein